MKKENLIFLSIGIIAGFLFTLSTWDLIEAQIPPTNAFQSIFVQTGPPASSNATVTASVYNDRVYFMAGPGIQFNVTSSP